MLLLLPKGKILCFIFHICLKDITIDLKRISKFPVTFKFGLIFINFVGVL